MAQKFLTNVELEAGLVDGSNSTGTSGYLLSSTGTATSWVDPAAVSVGESEQVHIACKNTSGVAISKGDPVYITGTVGNSFIIQIAAADASNSAKMPAVGLAETNLGINAEGFVIVSGVLKNLTTQPLSTGDGTPSSNDTVYVKAGGGLTRTKPTGSGNLIQNVGKVGRVNSANAGSLAVSTIMRTNDVPNLTTGKIWVGTANNTAESTVVHLDEPNNRIGINTNSPQVPLEAKYTGTVDEIVRIVGTASGKPQMTFYNDTTLHTKIVAAGNNDFSISNTHSTGDMFFATGGATRLHIEANGNVGIGTTSPSQKLHVSGSARVTGAYYDSNNSAGTSGQVLSSTGTGTDWIDAASGGGVDGSGSTNYVAKWSDSDTITNSILFDNGTNVGVSITSPSFKLDVGGTLRAGSLVSGELLRLNDSSTTGNPFLTFYQNNTRRSFIQHVDSGNNLKLASEYGGMQFFTGTGGTETVKMTIQAGGNVGIGTTAPASNKKLHVAGNTRVDSTFYLGTDDSCVFFRYFNSLIITNGASTSISLGGGPGNVNNNVFVGNGYLDVNGYIRGKNYFYLEDANGTLRTTLRSESTYATLDNGSNVLNYNAGNHYFLVGLSEKMRINSSGNVGIGTTTPGEKLEVNGTVKASATTDAYKGYIKQTVVSHAAEKVESTDYNFFPYNTTSTSTGAQTYNRMTAAYSGRIKKIYLRHSGASTPTATAVNFKKHTNGTTSSTVYSATVANTASTNMTAYYEFGSNDFTFNAGDLIGLLYQTTDAFGTASKTMGGVAATIIIEYNIT